MILTPDRKNECYMARVLAMSFSTAGTTLLLKNYELEDFLPVESLRAVKLYCGEQE